MEADIYDSMFRDQQHHWWFVARRRILRSVLDGLKLPAKPRICEAGCGVGGNLAMLQTYGELHAFEINASAIEKCRRISEADIREGALPDRLPYPDDERFDLIVSFDVLEHVERDADSMAALISRLSPGGYLFVTVPAHAWLMSAHDHAHHHFRRYSRPGLLALASGQAVEVLRCGYFNSLLFPLIASMRILGKGKRSKSDADMPSPWLNRFLTRVFALEALLTRKFFFPFGTSLGLVLRKKTAQA